MVLALKSSKMNQVKNPLEDIKFRPITMISGGDWNGMILVQENGNEEKIKIVFKDWEIGKETYTFNELIHYVEIMKKANNLLRPCYPSHWTVWLLWGKLSTERYFFLKQKFTEKEWKEELEELGGWTYDDCYFGYYANFSEFYENISLTKLINYDCTGGWCGY